MSSISIFLANVQLDHSECIRSDVIRVVVSLSQYPGNSKSKSPAAGLPSTSLLKRRDEPGLLQPQGGSAAVVHSIRNTAAGRPWPLERKRSADLVGLAADLDSNLRLVRVKPADSGTLIKLSQSLRANVANESAALDATLHLSC